jgi:bifunctional non-homologous end joining protein LigD
MLIRKNTKAFKTILEIFTASQERADREKLIRLYITRAGHTIHDRISVEAIEGDVALFYEMNYHSVLNNLQASTHQLHVSDEVPGIYFFHSTSNKTWDETPFEFDDAVKKEFSEVAELPVTRKKEKAEKFVFPTGKVKTGDTTNEKTTVAKKEKAVGKKAKAPVVIQKKSPRQPAYKLKHKIHFTDLEKVIFRQPPLAKEDILDYYYKMGDYILPYLKDRPLFVRLQSAKERSPVELNAELFKHQTDGLPDWIQSGTLSKGKEKNEILLCNDKEHLLFYVEMGCLEFGTVHARTKSIHSPDYLIVCIDAPDGDGSKRAEVLSGTRTILQGLQLPSFLKTDGTSGLHLYIPLDSKDTFDTSRRVAEYLCKLIALKKPDRTAFGNDGYVYGKVSLDFSTNNEGHALIAPFSIVAGDVPTIAVPLDWKDAVEIPRQENFNEEKVLKNLKQKADHLEGLFKKKMNASSLLDRLEKNYGFLFE